jgi:hypothetical protein
MDRETRGMKTSVLRVLGGFLTGWLLPPLLIAVTVGLLFGAIAPHPGEGPFDQVVKALIYAAVIGLPLNLGIMVVLVSPTWFVLHRTRAGASAFLICGAAIGGLVGLLPLAGPTLAGNAPSPVETVLTLLIPAVVGAASFLAIRLVAYRTAA